MAKRRLRVYACDELFASLLTVHQCFCLIGNDKCLNARDIIYGLPPLKPLSNEWQKSGYSKRRKF